MPTLPSVAALERPIPRSQRGIVVAQPRIYPSGIEAGAALAGAGQQLSGLGMDLARFNDALDQQQQRLDMQRAEDSYNNLILKKIEMTVGEQGFANRHGVDAIGKPLMQEYAARFKEVSDQIGAELGNDRQREYFAKRAKVADIQFREDILRHIGSEANAHAKQVFQSTLHIETQNATARWEDTPSVNLSLLRIENAVQTEAKRQGWDKETTDAAMLEAKSGVHQAVIAQALASGNVVFAKEWFDKHSDEVNLQTARATAGAVQDAEQKQLSNGYRSRFIDSRNSIASLKALEADIHKDETLNEDRKNALLGPIASRMDVLANRAEMAADRQMRLMERQLGKLQTMTLQGFEISPEQSLAVLSATKGTPLELEGKNLIATAAATREFRLAPPVQQEAAINRLEESVRTQPTPDRVELLTKFKTIADNQKRLIEEAPVAFAYRQGLASPVQIDFSNPMQSSEQIAAQVDTARGMQARYGAPLKPLMPDQLSAIKAGLERMNPQQKLGWFGSLRSATGGDAGAYSAMMAQLAPDDPVTAVAGEYSARGRTEPARLILEGQALLRPKTGADGRPDQGKLWPMPKETDLRSAFASKEKNAFAGKPETRNAAYQTTLAIYAKMSADAGDVHEVGVVNTDRFEKAMRLAIGNVEEHNGHQLIIPYDMEKSDFKQGLRLRVDELVASGNLDPRLKRDRLLDMPLYPIGDGRYKFKTDSGFLLDKNGKPVVVNFNMETIDTSRPKIENPDGTFSTEETITVESVGKHFLIPTIVGGKRRTEAEAIKLWESGKNKAVGTFSTAQEAEEAARKRSETIGQVRRLK